MGRTKLGPGYRFRPTDVELMRYYLRRKVMGKKLLNNDAIVELDIYKFHPADLADKSHQSSGDLKWYFFCTREKKYLTGDRAKRSTESGYWKVSGKDRTVRYNNEVVGTIRTLVFHSGKKIYGERTNWVMHEYKLEDKELEQKNVPQESYVLCVIFKKNGIGARHGDEYGAPFKDEDWSDHEEEDTENLVAIPSSQNDDPGPSKETSLVATASHSQAPKDGFNGVISESCVSDVPISDDVAYTLMSSPLFEVAPIDDDDLYAMDHFFDSVLVDGFDDGSEVRHDEPCVPFDEEALMCLEDVDFSKISDFSDDLFIELKDLTEPVSNPTHAETGDSKSNGHTTQDQI